MNRILLLGAGRSASSLIDYLIKKGTQENWHLRIGERDLSLAEEKTAGTKVEVFAFDVTDADQLQAEVAEASLVISMLPARFHILVATACAGIGRHLLTASYLTDDIRALDKDFKQKGVKCFMEMGLDPGLDHMSAMKVIDRLETEGQRLTSFETFTGGLLADDGEKDNPWHYKFTWNPRNVVLAGKGIVKFLQEGRYKYIPYHKLFSRTELIHIPGHGYFEGYANRDSLKYLDVYQLEGIQTLYRGTLRRPGFCKAWNIFVQLGLTDDSYKMEQVGQMTHRQYINAFLQFNPHDSVELKLAHYMNLGLESEEMYRLHWLGIFDNIPVGIDQGTPAEILQHILEKKWTLDPEDNDMIVMWHKFDYLDGERSKQIQSHMVVYGDDRTHTGMSKSVGLPLALTTELILQNKIDLTGVHIPTTASIYRPLLSRLEKMGFEFSERETIS